MASPSSQSLDLTLCVEKTSVIVCPSVCPSHIVLSPEMRDDFQEIIQGIGKARGTNDQLHLKQGLCWKSVEKFHRMSPDPQA